MLQTASVNQIRQDGFHEGECQSQSEGKCQSLVHHILHVSKAIEFMESIRIVTVTESSILTDYVYLSTINGIRNESH